MMTTWKDNNLLYTVRESKVVATDPVQLKRLIRYRISKYGPNCDLNDIDVSGVTDVRGV